MARYDKYDPKAGGFRAPLAADWGAGDVGTPFGVGLNASGRIVKGAGNTGVVGVLVINEPHVAGDPVDTMTAGEILDCAGLVAGTTYFANDGTGAVEAAAPAAGANKTQLGRTVQAARLVVRAQRVQG